MGDTDAAQVIYFAAPTRWAERMASEWLAEADFTASRQRAAGHGMPAVHVELMYHGPLRLDDEIDATLWLDKVSMRSFTLRSELVSHLRGRAAPASTALDIDIGVERLSR